MSRNRRVDTTTADELLSFILAQRGRHEASLRIDEELAQCRTHAELDALVWRQMDALERQQKEESRFRTHAEAIVRIELGDPSLLPDNWVAAVVIEDLLVLRNRSRATHAQGARRALRDLARPVDVTPRRSGRGRPRASAADRERQRQGLILKHLPWLYDPRDWRGWYHRQATAANLLARAGRAARFLLHRQRAPRCRFSHSWPEPSLVDDTIELAILDRVERSRANRSVSADGPSDPRHSLEWARAGLRVEARQRSFPFPTVPKALVDALSDVPASVAQQLLEAGHTRSAD